MSYAASLIRHVVILLRGNAARIIVTDVTSEGGITTTGKNLTMLETNAENARAGLVTNLDLIIKLPRWSDLHL